MIASNALILSGVVRVALVQGGGGGEGGPMIVAG